MKSEILTRIAVTLALLVTTVAAALVLRRRAVYLLGRRHAVLAPTILLTLWLTGLAVGQYTGSLIGMAFAGALPIVGAAVAARGSTGPRRLRLGPRFTWIDWGVMMLVGGILMTVNLFDVHCHRAVSAAYLRGNIPPTALNDPRFKLPYHSLFDAVVALAMRGLPVDVELALDLVAIGCVVLTMKHVVVLSRTLFRSPIAAQASRVLFFFGFGPTVLRFLWEGRSMRALHGETTQAYVAIMLRRPTVLGLTLFTLFLAMLAPLYRGSTGAAPPTRTRAGRPPHPLWLAPALFVTPLIAEELIMHIGVFALPLVLRRHLAVRWALAGAGVFLLGALASGLFATALGAKTSMAVPRLALHWPPTLPTWADADNGVRVASRGGGLALLAELGPLLAATFLLALWPGRRAGAAAGGIAAADPRDNPWLYRALLAPLAAGLAAAALLKLKGWTKADMDRFIFAGTPVAFMLVALWLDLAARRLRATRALVTRALATALVLVMAGPPAVYAVYTAATNPRWWGHFWREEPGETLRTTFAMVGRREAILTDGHQADTLVQAGFIVLGPMTSTSIGDIDEANMDEYLKTNGARADWFYLGADDPRVLNRPVIAKRANYVLVRARNATPAGASPAVGAR